MNAQEYYKQLLISAYIQLNNARANKTHMEMIGTNLDIRDADDYIYDALQIVKFIELNDPDKFHDKTTCRPL